jgi:outer membrane receptor protein involved in Fe transport
MRSPSLLLFIVLLTGISATVFSQSQPVRLIRGRVVDSTTNQPLPGATIQLLKTGRKTPVAGTVSGQDGRYRVETGNGEYEIFVEFTGYQPHRSGSFRLNDASTEKDLGEIRLSPAVAVLQEVVVQAEKSSMQLALDRKIFNVGKDLANAGGSANDILMNIPSVSVDPEGSVKLRGSDNVRILIDGKPSGLVSIKGGSGLNNLQAAMVERVEIITNPSARYEAEGNAGIINIILKKDRRQGFNGSFEVIGGYPANYGLAANLNYRKDKFNFFLNYGIAYRIQPTRGRMTQELYGKDTMQIMKQEDKAELLGFNNNIRAGLDYFFTEKSVLTLAYLYRRSQGNRRRSFVYDDYLFNLNNLQSRQGRTQDEAETEPNTEITVNYKRSFAQKGHELTAEVKYLDYWENSDQTFEQWPLILGGRPVTTSPRTIQRSLNDEWEKQYLLQLDYVKPIGSEGKFETGLRTSFRNMVNDYVVTQRNAAGGYDPLPGLDNIFEYDENIHAAYAILGNRNGKLSYQGGLRAEWTDVTTILRETGQRNPRNYGNLFPSAHLTYNLPNDHGIQLSYSRRVRRPVYNDLSPYATFSDARNFNGGNPDLDPEFSDVFEIGHLKTFPKGAFSASVYFRNTTEKIERIRQVDKLGNAFTQPQNLVGEKAYGIEATGSANLRKWWKMDANINFFHARVDGSNILSAYKTETFSWFARQTSRFSLKHDLDIQWRMNYEARQRLVQGSRKGYFFTDLSFSKDILAQRGTLTLNVMDVFNSRKIFYIIEGPGFHTDALMGFRPRQINMTFTYRIRQAKGTKTVKMINTD